jgi:hypothetical protein
VINITKNVETEQNLSVIEPHVNRYFKPFSHKYMYIDKYKKNFEWGLRPKTFHYLLFYIISLFGFISIILLNRISYQDSWILDGILVPTLVFILIYLITTILITDNKVIALISSSFVIVADLIPAFKYELFYGTPDVTFHYEFMNEIINSGHIPIDYDYTGVAGLHVFMGLFTLIQGISSNLGFKYAIPVVCGVFPLIIYFIGNKFISNDELMKYIIISSAFPLVDSYFLTGTIFALPFLLFSALMPIICHFQTDENRIKYSIFSIIIIFEVLISHTITSLFFIVFLASAILILLFFYKIKFLENKNFMTELYGLLILLTVVYSAWWMYQADFLFYTFVKHFVDLFSVHLKATAPIPSRFLVLTLSSKFKILLI